ncbi:uncharacterized protein METZ01_LOCUS378288, partial [marine metagenome]
VGTEFTYSNESGELYHYKVTIELSSELIRVHLESRGGEDLSGQIYGADFPEAVPRLFLELWN